MVVANIFVSKTLYSVYFSQEEEKMIENAKLVANRAKTYLDARRIKIYEGDIHALSYNQSVIIGARIMILNHKGMVLSDSERNAEGQYLDTEEVKEALGRNVSAGVQNYEGKGNMLYVTAPIIAQDDLVGISLLIYPLTQIHYKVKEVTHVMNAIFAIGILSSVFLGYVFATLFSRPIQIFAKTIKEIAKGNLNKKVEIKTRDEFSQLALSFNIMSTKLAQIDEERKNFVANVSHELKTPLSIIKVFTGTLMHEPPTDINAYREFIADIDGEIDRLNHIVDELLLLVNTDEKTLKLNLRRVDLNKLLYKLQQNLILVAHQKNILVDFRNEKSIYATVDEEKIYQVLLNLGNNAVKYTPNGGKIILEIWEKDDFVRIQIIDNGIGIAALDKEKIFERFYRTDKARGRKTGGAGLGLSIAKQIILLHQGKIEVESEVGKGSTFSIDLPKYLKMMGDQ